MEANKRAVVVRGPDGQVHAVFGVFGNELFADDTWLDVRAFRGLWQQITTTEIRPATRQAFCVSEGYKTAELARMQLPRLACEYREREQMIQQVMSQNSTMSQRLRMCSRIR
jgi:hypothetical protein